MTGIRAKDVSVEKIHRACCHLDGCGWKGTEYPSYQEANTERLAHITWHTLTAPDGTEGES